MSSLAQTLRWLDRGSLEDRLAEIKTMANLTHPRVLPLHDSGEAGGFLFNVMPYIEGDVALLRHPHCS